VIGVLIESGEQDPFEVFVEQVRRWERLADADGAHRDHEAAHEGRRARIATVGDTTYLDASTGNAQGAAMTEVLERFAQVEFEADWAATVLRHGGDANAGLLPRTDAQRRADALHAIFQRAAGAAPGTVEPEPVVNIVITQELFEAQIRAMVTDRPLDHEGLGVTGQFCLSANGLAVDPADAVAAALVGRVRRVVLDAAGVVINFGRRARVFTGAARDAAVIQAILQTGGRCLWPGCGRRRCQIDHSDDWSTGGSTDVANSGPLCPRHNRFKNHGYRTWRDPHGRWHLYRPDDTEITPA
jgi:hypothetical protein